MNNQSVTINQEKKVIIIDSVNGSFDFAGLSDYLKFKLVLQIRGKTIDENLTVENAVND